jgi:autotransporter-associated beta strand protein/T5SS/PEP-CTERM-associated repeat protein
MRSGPLRPRASRPQAERTAAPVIRMPSPAAPAARPALPRAVLLGGVWLGAFAVLCPEPARAQVVDGTWTGPGAEWTTDTNWSSSPTVPNNTASFTDNGAPTSVTISGPATINTMEFTATAPAYSFTVQNGATFTVNSTANSSSSVPDFTVSSGATLAISNTGSVEIGSLSGGGALQLGTSDPNTILFIAGSTSTTYSGVISGPGSIELDDAASLRLTGTGSVIGGDLDLCLCSTGSLTIDGGSLTVNGFAQGVTVEGGTLSVINGGTLQVGPTSGFFGDLLVASNMTISGPGSTVTVVAGGFTGVGVLGTGALTISNGGVLNSQGGAEVDSFFGVSTVSVTGPGSQWNIGGFGLSVGGGTTGGIGQLTIAAGGVVNTNVAFIGDNVDGSSFVLVTGAGSRLAATVGLSIGDGGCGCGPLVGTLAISDGGVVEAADTRLLAGSTLRLGTGGLGGMLITPTLLNDGAIVADFTDGITLAANISGTGTLSKAGVGTLTLTGNNSYTGGTTITGGLINFSSANSFGTGLITIDGGGLQWATGNSADISSQLAPFGAGGATFDTNGNNVTLASSLSGVGGLTKTGTGTVTLAGVNTYQGGTTINNGTLAVSSDVNLGSAAGGLTFGGGTLQFLSGFVSNRAVTLNAGGGTFDTNGNNAMLAGTIGGAGGLTKIGAGTLTLTGANAYGGGTAINGGALAVGSDANLGAAAGGLAFGGGTLQFLAGFTTNRAVTLNASGGTFDTNGNNATLAGTIGGAGGLTKAGAGTLILSGASSYTGTTSVNAGTLQAGAANTFAPTSAFTVAAGATLNLNSFNQTIGSLAGAGNVTLGAATLTAGGDNTSTAFSGTLSGTGSLTKIGAGTLTLSGANIYSGGTTLAGGTLRLENNQALGSGALTTTGSVVDYANGVTISNPIVINSTTTQLQVTVGSATQAGVISELNGPRPLEKIGAGALVLSAANTYSGPTTVSAGTLVVTGSIASSLVTVNNGGILTGTGTVGAATINAGGTFAPGSGTAGSSMTVAGNLAFQSGALYVVQVNPATASSASVIAGGSAALAGTVSAVFASGSYVSRTYTILSAAGGRTGAFNALTTTNLPAGFTADLSYTGTDVILGLTATLGRGPNALGASGLSINQRNVANSLNNFFNAGGALPPAFVSVFGLTGGNLGNALSQLSGEPATGSQQAAFQLGNQFLTVMLDPFVAGRGGLGPNAGGGAIGFAPERAPVAEDVALAYAAVLKAPKAQPAPTFEQRWGVWGAGYGGSNRTSGDPTLLGSHDLSARTAGFAGGFDYRFSPDTTVGVAFAGGGTDWSLAQGLGGGRSDAFQAGLYGVTRWDALYLAASFAYTNHWMSTDRFAFAGDHLTASFNAQSLGGRIESGYRIGTVFGALTPYAAVQAQSFRTPGYSETDVNGGGFALAYAGRTGTDTRTELGARFDRVVAFYPGAALMLRGRLAWAHDWVSDPTLAAAFQTLPGTSFVVNGALPARDSALTSAGAELRLANGVSLLGKFDGEFARGSSTYAGTGTIRYAW